MSDEVMSEILARALSDEAFRRLLLANPSAALAAYRLSDDERRILENLDEGSLDGFAAELDDRNTK
jgi:hypothetical protein